MTTQEQLASALTDVRRAYRLVYAYQRRLFDLMSQLDRALAQKGVLFEEWRSAQYSHPSKTRKRPVYKDCWAWDLIPAYWPRFTFSSEKKGRVIIVDVEVPVDTGFSKRGGEPDPSTFCAAHEARSEIWAEVWVSTAPLSDRTTAYNKLAEKHTAAKLDTGETFQVELDGRPVSYTLVRVDLSELTDDGALENKLVKPIVALFE